MAREHSFVLPSGVRMKIRNLTGGDQGTITKQDSIGKVDTFNQMLADCTLELGDKTTITKKDIERMLLNDRKYALVELRQFSLRYKKEFKFNYDWPIKGGKKDTQPYSVVFDRSSFDVIPFKWMKKALEELGEDKVKALEESGEFYPELYNTYQDMLEANSIQTFVLEDGKEVKWKIADCEQEVKFQEVPKEQKDVNLGIRMREPKMILKVAADGKEIPTSWDIQRADIIDVEAFREMMKDVEGSVDTSLTIQHETDPTKTARVDLIATVDFFFPSQAI